MQGEENSPITSEQLLGSIIGKKIDQSVLELKPVLKDLDYPPGVRVTYVDINDLSQSLRASESNKLLDEVGQKLGGIFQTCFGGINRSYHFGIFLDNLNLRTSRTPLTIFQECMRGYTYGRTIKLLEGATVNAHGAIEVSEINKNRFNPPEINHLFLHVDTEDEDQTQWGANELLKQIGRVVAASEHKPENFTITLVDNFDPTNYKDVHNVYRKALGIE